MDTLSKLPVDLRNKLESLSVEPLEDHSLLLQELDEYLAVARKNLHSRQLGLAEGIATRALELLNSQKSERGKRLAQAAVKYLLLTEDVTPDFDSPQGLEDDLQVFNAVASSLGREDLLLFV